MKKKVVIWSIILVLVSLWIYFKFIKAPSVSTENAISHVTENTLVTVEKKSFYSTVDTSGNTKIKNEQKLRFNTAGRITELKFNVGDKVRKGETIAAIDASEVYNSIEKAKIRRDNSQVKLDKFLDNLNNSGLRKSELDMQLSESRLRDKKTEIAFMEKEHSKNIQNKKIEILEEQNSYKILEKEIEKNIASLKLTWDDRDKILAEKKLDLEKSEREYKTFETKYDEKLIQKINEYNGKLEDQYFSLQTAITEAERNIKTIEFVLNLWDEDFKYYDYFAAQKTEHRSKAKIFLSQTKDNFKHLEAAFNNIKSKTDSKNIIVALEKEKTFNESLYDTANQVVKGFENSIETVGFDSWSISGYSGQYGGIRSSANSKVSSANSTIDSLKNYDSIEKIEADLQNEFVSLKNSIESKKLAIQRAIDNQDFLVWTSDYNIEAEKLKLEKAKLSLQHADVEFEKLQKNQAESLKQAKAEYERLQLDHKDLVVKNTELNNLKTNEEYILLKNDVKDNQVSLENEYKKLENYMLQAPFDGIITKLDIQLWDRLNADTEKYVSIADPDTIEVKTYVNQSDIVKVKQGMTATMKLDAYEDKSFSGVITEIDSTPTDQNGITKFETKVVLYNPEKLKLYSGMKANVKINVQNIPDAIVVPYTSVNIETETEKKYVSIQNESGEKEKRYITTGYTDGQYYEVTEGLTEWEKVYEIDYDPTQFKWDQFGGGDIEF